MLGIRYNHGFTLIELLVAISIVSLLSSLVMAAIGDARDRAEYSKALQFSTHLDRALGAEAVGMWNFENTATDVSGWRHHGTLVGNVTFSEDTYSDGLSGYALELDGVGDYVTTTYGDGVNPSTQKSTYSLWVKSDNPTAAKMFFVQGNWTSSSRAYFGHYGGVWSMGIQGSGWSVSQNAGSVDGDWHHIAIVFDGSVAHFYIDGKDKLQKNYTSYTFNQDLSIGTGRPTGTGYDWDGLIDDFRVYETDLTAQEIKNQYLVGVEKLYATGEFDEGEYHNRLGMIESLHE